MKRVGQIPLIAFFLFAFLSFSACLSVKAERFHWNPGRGYNPFDYETEQGILISNQTDTLRYSYYSLKDPADVFTLDFRARNITGNPSKKYTYTTSEGTQVTLKTPHWGFLVTTVNDTIAYSIKNDERTEALESVPGLSINVFDFAKNESTHIFNHSDFNPYDGENLFELRKDGGILELWGGNKGLKLIASNQGTGDITGFGFFAGWGCEILVSDINLEYNEKANEAIPQRNREEIDLYLSSSEDEMEGYWILFDRELEESLLKMGGDYTLACIKDGEGYDFIFMDGAVTNSGAWTPGDLKLSIIPTQFEGIYKVTWYDAMKQPLSYEVKAQRGEGNTLLIQFPYQSSKLRLRKISG